MKGTISNCLLQLIDEKYGKSKSDEIIQASEVEGVNFRLVTADIPDDSFMKLFGATLKLTGLSLEETCNAFGEYWCCTYAPKLYGVIVNRFKSSKEMIIGLDQIHIEMTETIQNAKPPRFDFDWEDDNTLRVHYKSDRNLIDVYAGLARGVGKLFNEELKVSILDDSNVKIIWA